MADLTLFAVGIKYSGAFCLIVVFALLQKFSPIDSDLSSKKNYM
jgi:hypothetical protein